METITNSEMFEKVARGEVTAQAAAAHLLASDDAARKQRVKAARPFWVHPLVWAIVTVLVVTLLESFQRRSA